MNKNKIILIIVLALIIAIATILMFNVSNNTTKSEDKMQVVITNFAAYDFCRAIIGDTDNIELTFLLGPAKDSHSYAPSAQDMIAIQEADLFIYVGGELETWIEDTLETLENTSTNFVSIRENLELLEGGSYLPGEDHDHNHDHDDEHEDEEDEHIHEIDDHVWTSPANAVIIVQNLAMKFSSLDSENSTTYIENANDYVEKIKEVDLKIADIVDKKNYDMLIFGDQMPMQYFILHYGLDVVAAYSSCSTATEVDPTTIEGLIDTVNEHNIPVVLYIELSEGAIAQTVANECPNAEIMQIQTLHNVSVEDFNNGETWVSLMNRNIDVLTKALI